MTQIADFISSKTGRSLNDYEAQELVNYAKKQKNKDWLHKRTGELMTVRQIREFVAYQFWKDHMGSEGADDNDRKQEKLEEDKSAPFKYSKGQSDIKEILKSYTGNVKDGYDVDFDKLDMVDENGNPYDPTIEEDVDMFQEGGTIGNVGNIEVLKRILKIDNVVNVDNIANIEKLFGKSDEYQLQHLLNPQAQERRNYITLDTKYKLTSGSTSTQFMWNFLNNSSIESVGAASVIGEVSNLKQINVHRLRIPYVNSADNSNKKITMLVEEFSAQSYVGFEGRRYHFQFTPEIDANQINLLPWSIGDKFGEFKFRIPITQINTFTVSFGSPLTLVEFDNDRLNATVSYTANGLFTTTEPHNLLTGDVVSFTNFTSLAPAVDEPILDLVNAAAGNSVVVIDNFNFEINVDLTAITAPLFPQSVVAYFESKRIFIDLELIYEEQSQTD